MKTVLIFRKEETKKQKINKGKTTVVPPSPVPLVNPTPVWTFEEFQTNLQNFVPYIAPQDEELK
jgi:hypothetical protein